MQTLTGVAIVVAFFASGADAHASMIEPPSRNGQGWNVMGPGCPGGSCLFFVQGAGIGCHNVTGMSTKDGIIDAVLPWRTGPCPEHAEPTIPLRDRTYNKQFKMFSPSSWVDWTKFNPWRFPGSAPVADACGIAGGWTTEGPVGSGGTAPFGVPQGMPGSNLSKLLKETVWIAGSVAEVALAIQANHGGGYQYRLCPANSPLTEACFQQNPLEFVGNTQWIQWGGGYDVNNRTEIRAARVSEGTMPAGSTWTMNPIPACGDSFHGGSCDENRVLTHFRSPLKCFSTQFPAPADGAFGFGGALCAVEPRALHAHPKCRCTLEDFRKANFDFSIVDQVRVPETPGEYVLGWRWDSEQTNQVWNNCADVRIVKKGEEEPTKPFEHYEGCEACCDATWGICSNCTACLNDKSGDCAYCWTPLPGQSQAPIPYVPAAQCLGHEGASGGPLAWKAGDNVSLWSPGCTRCWSDGTCKKAAAAVAAKRVRVVV